MASYADSIPDEQILPPSPQQLTGGYTGIYLDDTTNFTGFPTYLAGINASSTFLCTSISDSNCESAARVEYRSYLNPCLLPADVNCLEGIKAISPNGDVEVGTYVRNYPEKFLNGFNGDVSKGLPSGGSPSLWSFEKSKHSGGSLYLATPNFNQWNWKSTVNSVDDFSAGIYPVGIVSGDYKIPTVHISKGNALGYSLGADETTPECAMRDTGTCAKIFPFPRDTRFSMTLRTSLPITGFLHGRMNDPRIDFSKDSSKITRLTVEAAPITVPIFGVWSKNSDLPIDLNNYLDSQIIGGRFYYSDGSANRSGIALLRDGRSTGYTDQSIKEFSMWLPLTNDKSMATKSVWGFKTLPQNSIRSNCYSSGESLSGIVTTNATMYEASPPNFNQSTQSLEYKVSSPHFDKNGQTNSGTYSLVLSSRAARCLYGFTSAPIKATISVISADGSSQLATTIFGEKNGWLSFQASGFSYSAPKIEVKLTQPTLSSRDQNKTLNSVTCVKGKAKRVFKGNKVSCPSGYKKVA